MSAASVHCPYCNAQFAPPKDFSGARIACPRCGEGFPYRPTEPASVPADAANHSSPAEAPVPPAPRLPVSNRVIALVLLGSMAVMALLGGIFAWETVLVRRGYDSQVPRPSVIDIPLVARIALGVYVLVMVVAILHGWHRRESAEGTKKSKLSQYGIPALALMVLLGVGLVLLAIQQRAVHPPVPSMPEGPDAVPAVLPSELAALRYVPDDAHLLVGIHIAEAWRTPAGRRLLDSSQQLVSVTGLKIIEVDHAVLAVKLDRLLPRFFLIVRTIRPYDQAELSNALKATKLATTDNRAVYEFTMQQPPLRAVVWFAEDKQTMVIAWPGSDLREVPNKPREGLNHLPNDLRSVLKEHLDAAARKSPAQLWFAGQVENWDKLAAQFWLAAQFKDAWPLVAKIKTAGAWAQLSDDANLQAVCKCADAESAEALRDYLQGREAGQGLAGLLPKDTLLAEDIKRSLKITRDGDRTNLAATISAETIQKAAATPGK